MDFLKKVWFWVVYSSTNEDKISLTIKGFLGVAVVALTYYFNVIQAPVNPDQLTMIVDGILKVVQALCLVSASLVTVIGAIRKLYTTSTNTNAVLNG